MGVGGVFQFRGHLVSGREREPIGGVPGRKPAHPGAVLQTDRHPTYAAAQAA